ncbi:MAG: fumarate reductase/succinate dehydrogenase flavoprotein subunit, partial [Pseudonocardia sp.]
SYVDSLGSSRPLACEADVEAAARRAVAPFDAGAHSEAAENPYCVHQELQQTMNDLVGIIRTESEMTAALDRLGALRARLRDVVVEGHRQYNPGWHLALDLRNMLMVGEAVASSALRRTESRGGHTRDDYPTLDPQWRHRVLVTRCVPAGRGDDPVVPRVEVDVAERDPMRDDLLALFDLTELEKYYTPAELTAHPQGSPGRGTP